MKCEKCNQNEASVYYRASINGETSEQHLCAECAGELGLDRAFSWQGRDLFEEAFGGFFGRDPFESFFGGSLLPSFARRGVMTLPRMGLNRGQTRGQTQTPAETKADAELSARRERIALREQLNAAVKAEDFEKAIELRDKLRELEK